MKILTLFLLIALTSGSAMTTFAQTGASTYDIVITNARIIDGTGNPWFRGEIAIKDGRIVKVGRIDKTSAGQIIDAHDQIVAPGFFDVHTHVEDVFGNPNAENFVRMGVT